MPLTTKEHNMKSLIDLGAKGLYPLFHPEWIERIIDGKRPRITGQDRIKNKAIAKTLAKYKNLDRKKTILMALTDEERTKFIIDFLQKVETKILESRPEIQ